MTATNRIPGVAFAVAAAAALVWASNVPLTIDGSADAVLRLAWGVRPERIETCRELTAQELANVPQHMRQERVCEGTTAAYRLVVRDEHGVRVDRLIRGGGLRQDRRLYVFEELPLPSGTALVDVRFERVGTSAGDDDRSAADEADDRHEGGDNAERQGAIPRALSLVARVTARPREVILVTYDPELRALVTVQRSPR